MSEDMSELEGAGATGLFLVEAMDDTKHSKMDHLPRQRTISLQMKIVPLLKKPTTGVGWLLADLEGPPLGQLGQLGYVHGLLSSSRLSWPCCHRDGKVARTSRIAQGISQSELGTGTSPLLTHSIGQSQSQARPPHIQAVRKLILPL